jgi:hypothetical protein
MSKREGKTSRLDSTAETIGAGLGHLVAKVESWNRQRAVIADEIRQYMAAAHKLLAELGHTAAVARTQVAAVAAATKVVAANRTGRRPGFTMSAEAKKKISIAAKARWAAKRGEAVAAPAAPAKSATKATAKKKRFVSPEARAKLAKLAKARWAKVKKAGKNKLG